MKFVLFYHSLSSDWNHGNAHFLRGIATELIARGHDVRIYEPSDGWSLTQLIRHEGEAAVRSFAQCYPELQPVGYTLADLDLDVVLDDADIVIVHEWNPPELLLRIGRHRRRNRHYRLWFHDTHHRAASAPEELARFPLDEFDGTLAFGEALAELYRRNGWGNAVRVWHEAADTRVFRPAAHPVEPQADLVWIGNWGDDERSSELREFVFDPARACGLSGSVYGVRYPQTARETVRASGLAWRGWVANFAVPALFHRHRFTVHVPRRFYREALPGIPTIRVFEALACGIPLVSAPWSDAEGLFRTDRDFVMVRDGAAMQRTFRDLLNDPARASEIARSGLETIERHHTCAHRVDELLNILSEAEAVPAAAVS